MSSETKADTTELAKLIASYVTGADSEVERWKTRAIQATNELTERREEVRALKRELNEVRADLARAQSDERARLDQERIARLVEECSAAWEMVAKAEGSPALDSMKVSFEEVDKQIQGLEDANAESVAEATRRMAERMKSVLDPVIMHALARIYHAKLHATKKGSESDALTWWGPVSCAFISLFRDRPDVEAEIQSEMRVAAGIGNPDRFVGDEDDD